MNLLPEKFGYEVVTRVYLVNQCAITRISEGRVSSRIDAEGVLYSVSKMTIQTKSMMRRRVNRAGPSGLV